MKQALIIILLLFFLSAVFYFWPWIIKTDDLFANIVSEKYSLNFIKKIDDLLKNDPGIYKVYR